MEGFAKLDEKNRHVNHEMLGYNEYLLAGFHHEIRFFFSEFKHQTPQKWELQWNCF
jgi:hypothetical protein